MAEDFEYIPVRHEWIDKVYAYLGELARDESADASGSAPQSIPSLDQDLVQRMYSESYEPHKRLLRLLADHPDEWLYSRQIADGLKLEHGSKSLAGMLGAFGRRAKHRYHHLLPWRSEWDPAKEEMRHQMSAEVATWVRALPRD